MTLITPYDKAVEFMKNDPSLKHVIFSWQVRGEFEHSHGVFRFHDDQSFELFVQALYRTGVEYIGAVHR